MTQLLDKDELIRTSGDVEALSLPPVRLTPRMLWAICPMSGIPVASWAMEARAKRED